MNPLDMELDTSDEVRATVAQSPMEGIRGRQGASRIGGSIVPTPPQSTESTPQRPAETSSNYLGTMSNEEFSYIEEDSDHNMNESEEDMDNPNDYPEDDTATLSSLAPGKSTGRMRRRRHGNSEKQQVVTDKNFFNDFGDNWDQLV